MGIMASSGEVFGADRWAGVGAGKAGGGAR